MWLRREFRHRRASSQCWIKCVVDLMSADLNHGHGVVLVFRPRRRACSLAFAGRHWRRARRRCRAGQAVVVKLDEAGLIRLTGLGEIQCTLPEVASVLGFGQAALTGLLANDKAAKVAFESGKLRGLEALRRAQFKLAETNATMAIFLGKTYLGQSDRREQEQGDAFDFSGAARRLHDKLAAIAFGPSSPGDFDGV
jgi:hypothetical protein